MYADECTLETDIYLLPFPKKWRKLEDFRDWFITANSYSSEYPLSPFMLNQESAPIHWKRVVELSSNTSLNNDTKWFSLEKTITGWTATTSFVLKLCYLVYLG